MNEFDKQQYQASLKHQDVEEPIDLWFYRPMGFRLAMLGRHFHWTPNQITIASIFLGMGCGVLCYPTDWKLNLLGMVLLVLADICDSADGQLARLTHQYSPLGRILDGAAGDIWFVTIYFSLLFRLWPELGWWGFFLALLAGLSHRQQAAMADYYRQIHLFMVKAAGSASSIVCELSDYDSEKRRFEALSLKKQPIEKVFQWFYLTYTQFQERRTSYWQQLRKKKEQSGWTPNEAEYFRLQSRPLMPIANALSFNCRAITLFLALMLGMPWLYWTMEIVVFNVLYFYMIRKHEQICRQALG